MKYRIQGVSLFIALYFCMSAITYAKPYQFEISGNFASEQSENSFTAQELEAETTGYDFDFYLNPVKDVSGPLIERPFLSKASSITLQDSNATPSELHTFVLKSRMVNDKDKVWDLSYAKSDDGSNSESRFTIGYGAYLNDMTALGLSVVLMDGEYDTASAYYKGFMVDTTTGQQRIGYDIQLGTVTREDDKGFTLGLEGAYFFSDVFSAKGGYQLTKVGEFDSETNITVGLDYFATQNIFASVGFSRNRKDGVLIVHTIGAKLGVRF